MKRKYYLDTSIWIDYYEDRKYRFRPLGEWAHRLLSMIEYDKDDLLISDVLEEELERRFSKEKVDALLNTYRMRIKRIESSEKQLNEAKILAKKRGVPKEDALHAIIARDKKALLIARDHHFENLFDITISNKPEDLI